MMRRIRIAPSAPKRATAVALLWPDGGDQQNKTFVALDKQVGRALSEALKRPETSLKCGAVTCVYPTTGPQRVYLVGLGPVAELDADAYRVASAKLLSSVRSAKLAALSLVIAGQFSGMLPTREVGRALGEGLAAALFSFDEFKGAANGNKNGKDAPATLTVHVERDLRAGMERGLLVGESANLARQMAATPPNVANPSWLVSKCKALAKQVGLRCRIIGVPEAKRLKMGGLLAVGAGGSTPPAMIVLEHQPRSAAARKQKPILLVGKAVTFDTGGYSLKPSTSMDGMKYDKCGGMAVIGAMHAIAKLKLDQPVVALIPTAENMVDTAAYRPGDIITFCNGVTCEVTNTDAEGRLILADALAYGTKHYQPRAVIDLATLTGGVVIALGSRCAGAFVNCPDLRKQLFDSGQATGELLWHLPLWLEHRDLLKSPHGDIVNSAAVREAHAIQGAAFLSYFIHSDDPAKLPTLPWAHLDIAGVADSKTDTELYTKGPTGFGVRLLTHAVENWR